MSTRVARHHFHQLMVLYPHQLHPTAICGCDPRDVTLINEADLRHLGRVDMVTNGLCNGGLPTNILLQGISSRIYLCWETIGTSYWKDDIMFVNTLEIPFLWMPRALVLMSIGLGGCGPTLHRY